MSAVHQNINLDNHKLENTPANTQSIWIQRANVVLKLYLILPRNIYMLTNITLLLHNTVYYPKLQVGALFFNSSAVTTMQGITKP